MIAQERRAETRRRRFVFGTVKCSNQRELLCIVKDISSLGAMIEVEDAKLVTEQFVLFIDKDTKPHTCKVVWRLGAKLGVMFVTPPPVLIV